MRRTKLVCTIGPRTHSMEMMKKLVEAGMNVARLNSSHGTIDEHREYIRRLKAIRDHLKIPLAIMIDLEGPKIRLGSLGGKEIELSKGQTIVLTREEVVGDEEKLPVVYEHLTNDLEKGDVILINDGKVKLEVLERIDGNSLKCLVKVGGTVGDHKGVNLPGVKLSLPSLTDKDKEFITLGVEEKVDYFALSFVRTEMDVMEARRLIKRHGSNIPIIAKIETKQAMQHLENIATVADGLMVARGDLGVELSVEEVPMAQKRIIKVANRYSIPVITATQMLDSMVSKPVPTRAEASDIANAILDGTDAVMLSNETAVGEYPLEAVDVINRVAENVEPHLKDFKGFLMDWLRTFSPVGGVTDAISRACVEIAEELDVKAIVPSTFSGFTAKAVARFRPQKPIIAITPNLQTFHALALVWGVVPVLVNEINSTDEMFNVSEKVCEELGYARKGDKIVITAGVPFGVSGKTNILKIQEL